MNGKYDEKVDIWSIGVITYVMLSGNHPFTGKTAADVLAAVKQGRVVMNCSPWPKVSHDAKSLVQVFLQKQPTCRPAAARALLHPWLEETDKTSATISMLEVNRLKNFSKMHQLKKAALTAIATQLDEGEIIELRDLFMSMDKNADGTLSVAEIKTGLQSSGVKAPTNLEKLMNDADCDGSGVIDYTEFLAATLDKKVYHQESVLWQAFKKFDMDGSGRIDMSELRQVLGQGDVAEALHLTEKDQLQELFDRVDKNGDGEIDFDEFMVMMRNNTRCRSDKKSGTKSIGLHKRKQEVGESPSQKPSEENHLWRSTGSESNPLSVFGRGRRRSNSILLPSDT